MRSLLSIHNVLSRYRFELNTERDTLSSSSESSLEFNIFNVISADFRNKNGEGEEHIEAEAAELVAEIAVAVDIDDAVVDIRWAPKLLAFVIFLDTF